MITEITRIDIKPGMESEFEAAAKKGAEIFRRAKGCRSIDMQRSIERPSRYIAIVTWDTLENHTVDFRGSGLFAEWQKLVDPLMDKLPDVEHTTHVGRVL